MESNTTIRRLQQGTPDVQTPATIQRAEGDQKVLSAYPDCKWHDPDWLSSWLRTHYLLSPQEQMRLGAQLLDVIHVPECRTVIVSYMHELDALVNLHDSGDAPIASNTPSPIQGMGEAGGRVEHTLEAVLRTTFKRYPVPIAFLVFMLVFYAYQGVQVALDWLF